MSVQEELMGCKFGLLTPVKVVETDMEGAVWECLCDCGKRIKVRRGDLLNMRRKSCGCLRHRAHDLSRTPEYRAFQNALDRCHNPRNARYERYGGRGIAVCHRWNPAKGGSFLAFMSDMGKKPRGPRKYSLDRRDNNRGYTPKNCYWATYTEQQRNRCTVKLTMGKARKIRELFEQGKKTKTQLAKRYGVDITSIRDILNERTWREDR